MQDKVLQILALPPLKSNGYLYFLHFISFYLRPTCRHCQVKNENSYGPLKASLSVSLLFKRPCFLLVNYFHFEISLLCLIDGSFIEND